MRNMNKPEKHVEPTQEERDELETGNEQGEQQPPFDYDIRDTIEKLSS